MHIVYALLQMRNYQASEEIYTLLEKLVNNSDVYIGSRSAILIGKTYSHFGNEDKAIYYYQKAKQLGAKEEDFKSQGLEKEYKSDYVIPKKIKFTKGKVYGNILLNGKTNEALTVGLIREKFIGQVKEKNEFYFGPFYYVKFATAVKPDRSGHFEMSDIVEGSYCLFVSADTEILPFYLVKLSIKEKIRKIIISRRTPSIDLGMVNLKIKVGR